MIVHEEDYEDYLKHFGVPGMKWGHRKAEGSGGSSGHATAKKVIKTTAAAAIVVGGVAASAYVLKKYGAKKAIEVGKKSYETAKKVKEVSDTVKSDYNYQPSKKVLETKVSDIPSPQHLLAQAQTAKVRNQADVQRNQQLTDKAWRDSVKINQLNRDMDSTTAGLLANNDALLKAMQRR